MKTCSVAGLYQTPKNDVTAIDDSFGHGFVNTTQENKTATETLADRADDKSRRPKLTLRKRLAFLAVAMLMAFLLCEALLVLLGISFPLLYQTDEYCGVRLKSNLNVRYIEEGKSIVRTNQAGFRDIERSKSKADNVFRIAVLGDSFCEAIQVSREQSFCFLLEEQLRESNSNVEVLNFGVSGFGTAQEYEMLRHEVLDYHPDLVIVTMFLGNDIGDNSRKINPGQIKPYYEWVDEKLKLDDSFLQDPQFLSAQSWSTRFKSTLINSSRSAQLVNKLYSRWKNSARPRANVGIGLDPNLYKPPTNEDWQSAWIVTEQLLAAMKAKCYDQGADFVVVTLTNPIQVHPDAQLRDKFMTENEINSLFYPDDRIRRFCAQNKIKLLQLSRLFYEEVTESEDPVYFHGFSNTEMGVGHWNELGHQRASEKMADYLMQKKIVGE